MENETSSPENKNGSSAGKWVAAIVILIIVVVGVYFWYHSNKSASQSAMQASPHQNTNKMNVARKGASGSGNMHMNMQAQPTPTLTAQQTQELTVGSSSATTQKTFDIGGGNFYFVPNKITVHKGDKVTFVLHNNGGFHNLIIDELGVKTTMTKTGETATATFTADKIGTFVYYCNVPGHRQKGMLGTLTVE